MDTSALHVRLGAEIAYEAGLGGAASHGSVGVVQAVDTAGGAIEIAGGIRLALGAMTPAARGAAFVRGSVCARQGSYRPAIGLELVITAVPGATPSSDEPEGSLTRAIAKRAASGYLETAIVMAPARFQWSNVFLSVGALRVVVPLQDVGTRVHLGVGLVDGGWRF